MHHFCHQCNSQMCHHIMKDSYAHDRRLRQAEEDMKRREILASENQLYTDQVQRAVEKEVKAQVKAAVDNALSKEIRNRKLLLLRSSRT